MMISISMSPATQNISFIFLTISLSIIGFLYAFYYKYTKEFILCAFGQRFANQYFRDENVFKRRVRILFSILMVLNISFMLWSMFPSNEVSIFGFLIILFFTIIYYVSKYIYIWFLGHLLKMNQIASIGIFYSTLYDKVFSLLSFPIIVIFHFFIIDITEISSLIILIFLIIFFILKIFWTLKIGIKSFGLSRFYLFLYICMLEFFPLALLYRGIIFQ